MANKMLIDATHGEETRVVVVRGNKVEEFDFESSQRKQLRGNIYLAKVIRVEPSLQAAFVEYGGNRHGFLAFSEIHPDYYQIPVADRQALLEEEAFSSPSSDDFEEERGSRRSRNGSRRNGHHNRALHSQREASISAPLSEDEAGLPIENPSIEDHEDFSPSVSSIEEIPETDEGIIDIHADSDEDFTSSEEPSDNSSPEQNCGENDASEEQLDVHEDHSESVELQSSDELSQEPVDSLGHGDDFEEMPRRSQRRSRQYKIQEVIKRRQVILVQVVKEERGNKGAALTTYLSLAGRYSVLMPNTARGGGISRKITNAQDRSRLKEIVEELEVPEGMGVILRTAGANRTKLEVKRDFEYLLRLWETVREATLRSSAPMLVYEEGNLVKRAIRDLYNKDIDEVLVSGEQGYQEAHQFMRMLMPSHARNVIPYRESLPIFAKYGVESQLDAMFSSEVTLRSGGYIVINQTEALVAIDVNSGRSTREHNIEDTALKTNLEAAEEIARQLRLRDLAGLIVCDFIDMEEKRNNRAVEKRIKECLKNDRARIQIGHISHFGLLEMSRQRIRTGVLESSTEKCKACSGSGYVRSSPSKALNVLRSIEDYLLRNPGYNLTVRTPTETALYVLNQKRQHVFEIERRFGISILFNADDTLPPTEFLVIQKGDAALPVEAPRATSVRMETVVPAFDEADVPSAVLDEDIEEAGSDYTEAGTDSEGENGRKRRRRRRRRGGRDRGSVAGFETADASEDEQFDTVDDTVSLSTEDNASIDDVNVDAEQTETEEPAAAPRRRRGRRGGRNRSEQIASPLDTDTAADEISDNISENPDAVPVEEHVLSAEISTAPEETATVEKPKARVSKPRTRRRTSKATEETEVQNTETETPTAVHLSEEPRQSEAMVRSDASAPADNIDVVISEPAAPLEVQHADLAVEEAPSEPRPRRTGWWQRKIFGE